MARQTLASARSINARRRGLLSDRDIERILAHGRRSAASAPVNRAVPIAQHVAATIASAAAPVLKESATSIHQGLSPERLADPAVFDRAAASVLLEVQTGLSAGVAALADQGNFSSWMSDAVSSIVSDSDSDQDTASGGRLGSQELLFVAVEDLLSQLVGGIGSSSEPGVGAEEYTVVEDRPFREKVADFNDWAVDKIGDWMDQYPFVKWTLYALTAAVGATLFALMEAAALAVIAAAGLTGGWAALIFALFTVTAFLMALAIMGVVFILLWFITHSDWFEGFLEWIDDIKEAVKGFLARICPRLFDDSGDSSGITTGSESPELPPFPNFDGMLLDNYMVEVFDWLLDFMISGRMIEFVTGGWYYQDTYSFS